MTTTNVSLRSARGKGRLRDALRSMGILALIAASAAHIPVTPEHLREVPYVGMSFMALIVACLALAASLAVRDSPVAWVATSATTSLAIAAYMVSRSVGLPDLADDIGNWREPLGVAAITAEAVALLAACCALAPLTRREARTRALFSPDGRKN